ncbi:MAG: TldD/PmbA family protein [Acidimicrobiia bacterium]|nr:TldD/PmbA family protein [Acidimicrobiia bacterium]
MATVERPSSAAVDEEVLLGHADRLVAMAQGGEQVEVVVASEMETEIRVHKGDVESLTAASSAGAGVRVVHHGRQGFAWAGTLDPDALEEALEAARDNARFASEDPHAGLADPDGVTPADLVLHDPGVLERPTADKVELALEVERATLAADERIVALESAEYADVSEVAAIASTTGIRAVGRQSGAYVSVYAMAGEGDDVQTGFGYSVARGPAGVSPAATAEQAALRATRMLGATKPPSGRFTVVLDPWVTAQLLGVLGVTLSGEMVVKGRSFLADRLGEEVAAAAVTVVDDPTDPEAFTAAVLDGEGLATRRNVLIDGGTLASFVYDAHTARRAGVRSTGSAVRRGVTSTPSAGCAALSMLPGDRSPADILGDVGDGVYVCDVAGLHSGVNPVSGDLSCGAEGLRIRHGELAEPLREFTIGSTLQRLLTGVVAVGNDRTRMPMSADGVTLAVADVTISGS